LSEFALELMEANQPPTTRQSEPSRVWSRTRMLRPTPFLDKFAVIAAIGAAVWGLWCWVELYPDLTTRLRDDAYYEFVWAANLFEGRGPVVSDGVTTSGVQLLWSLLLAGVAWLFGTATVLPILAPWLGLLFHFATALVVGRLSRDRVTRWCLMLCWLGHPLLLREAENGQETALCVFFAASLVVSREARERWFLPLSILTVLARSDLFALVLMLSFCRHRQAKSLRGWLAAVPAPLLALLVPNSINYWLSGSWLPDSAFPMAWLFHTNLSEASGFWSNQWWFTRPVLLGGPFATASAFGFGLVVFQLIRPWWPATLRVVPAVLVGVASALGVHDLLTVGWAALLLALFPSVRLRRLSCRLLAVTLGLSAIVVLHWAMRWYPRDYYLAPLVIVGFVAMARFGRWRILLLVFAVAQVQDSWRIKPEPLAGQQEMALAGWSLHTVLPTEERVGCFNSGIVTWSTGVGKDWPSTYGSRGILNLDGVVDARSFAALQDGRLSEWLDEQGVRFLLDSPMQFELDPSVPHACGMHFGNGFDPAKDLVEVVRFDVPGIRGSLPQGDSMRLYWRRGRGEMPGRPVALGELKDVTSHPSSIKPAATWLWWWGARPGEVLVQLHDDGRREELASTQVETAVLVELEPFNGRLVIESR
jgi:hypothetical protein